MNINGVYDFKKLIKQSLIYLHMCSSLSTDIGISIDLFLNILLVKHFIETAT